VVAAPTAREKRRGKKKSPHLAVRAWVRRLAWGQLRTVMQEMSARFKALQTASA
jgi:hypothetical protein